jgi:hypothetical protein
LALAGIAALFFIGKGSGKTDHSNLPSLDDLGEGDLYPDTTVPNTGAHSSGGTKAPSGEGHGGSDWWPSKPPGPRDLWISPDCYGVYEGPEWYEQTFLPEVEKLMAAISEANQDYEFESGTGASGGEVSVGGFIKIPAVLLYAYVAGMMNADDASIVEEAVIAKPNSCIITAPWFQLPTASYNVETVDGLRMFRDHIDEWTRQYPALGGFLSSLESRMNADAEGKIDLPKVRVWNLGNG